MKSLLGKVMLSLFHSICYIHIWSSKHKNENTVAYQYTFNRIQKMDHYSSAS